MWEEVIKMLAFTEDSAGKTASRRLSFGAIFAGALAFTLAITLIGQTESALARPGDSLAAPAGRPSASVNRPGFGGPPARRGAGLRGRARTAVRTERAMEAIDALRLERLAQTLNLSDEQKKIVRDAYSSELIRKRDLMQERMQILSKMQQLTLIKNPADLQKAQPEMRNLVVNFKRVQRQIAETEWTTQDEILGHLNPDQRVRCILFNEAFDRRLRSILMERQQPD